MVIICVLKVHTFIKSSKNTLCVYVCGGKCKQSEQKLIWEFLVLLQSFYKFEILSKYKVTKKCIFLEKLNYLWEDSLGQPTKSHWIVVEFMDLRQEKCTFPWQNALEIHNLDAKKSNEFLFLLCLIHFGG